MAFINVALPFLSMSSRHFLPGPPDVQWHGAPRSQLLWVRVQGFVGKEALRGLVGRGALRVSLRVRRSGLWNRPWHPNMFLLLLPAIHSELCILMLNTQAIRLWPFPMTQCHKKRLGQTHERKRANLWCKNYVQKTRVQDPLAVVSKNGIPQFSANYHSTTQMTKG